MAVPATGVALAAGTSGASERHLDALAEAAVACEAAGIDLLLLDGRPRRTRTWRRLDPYALLGALAGVTRTLRLGALVAADERAPSLAAKATSTLDVCSDGRALLVLARPAGRGGPPGLELLAECSAVAAAMLAVPSPTVVGRHVAVHEAWNEPRAHGGPPPVGVAVAAASPRLARRRVAGWPTAPTFLLAERRAGAAAGPAGAATPGATPVLALVGAADRWPAGDAFDGLVVALRGPEQATADLLGRVAGHGARGVRV